MSPQRIAATHLDVVIGQEFREITDQRWRDADAAAPTSKPPVTKPKPPPPTRPAPKPKPRRKTTVTTPTASKSPVLEPGSLVLSPGEVVALEHLLDHPDVKAVIEQENST